MLNLLLALFFATAASALEEQTNLSGSSSGTCVLPSYPEHGRYSVAGVQDPAPGQRYDFVNLNVSCNSGYFVQGKSHVFCFGGVWSDDMPSCVRMCTLRKHPSVEYTCVETSNQLTITRICQEHEPSGTVVYPRCRAPNYFLSGIPSSMKCIEGSWNHVVTCKAECGQQLHMGGSSSSVEWELPWHASIYTKLTTPYEQMCGGSLVTSTAVISAAQCFWRYEMKPASDYAVAVGKIYRGWNDPRDVNAQKSDVSEIKVPARFTGLTTNFQEDIALVFLSTPIQFNIFVKPVCLDFDYAFQRAQLQEGKLGKVAGWGLTTANSNESQVVEVVELPYIDISRCLTESPSSLVDFITSDKICAGHTNGTALCNGNTGGGFVFPDYDRGRLRYYLRGIVSTAPQNDNECNANAYIRFTEIIKHERFIKYSFENYSEY